jgi:hypothetical protein
MILVSSLKLGPRRIANSAAEKGVITIHALDGGVNDPRDIELILGGF